jgi:DNA topoisomerase VI subunit B
MSARRREPLAQTGDLFASLNLPPDPPSVAAKDSSASKKPSSTGRKRVSAETLSAQHREISISEFFTKNRHLLGFDNASRALLTSVKEAVDNSLDACEEAGILPDIMIRLEEKGSNRYQMTVEDNGPGIVKSQIPKVFGKLLYGSKFHRLRQSRGQQGIGISAAGMYGQLTTGKPVVITSKTGPRKRAHYYELVIDTTANRPKIIKDETLKWEGKDHGTLVMIEMEASYKGGKKSVDEFIQTVALANPHVRMEYWRPNRKPIVYPRVSHELPPETKEIKPHPYGVELGILMRMLAGSSARNVVSFFQKEFSRVSAKLGRQIVTLAGVDPKTNPQDIDRHAAEAIYQAIAKTKIMAPPTDCLAPIGEAAMLEGLKALMVQQHMTAEESKIRRKQRDEASGDQDDEQAAQLAEEKVTQALEGIGTMRAAEDSQGVSMPRSGVIEMFGKPCFLTSVTRAPKVYRGNPFQVEAAIAYGGELEGENLAQMHRFANRVPLLYQQGACAMTQGVLRTNWRSYGVSQSRGALPSGPILILVHIASVWVPFTSEAKEALAHYDDIITELKFALQECGRRLGRHLSRRRRVADEDKKRRYIEQYIPQIGDALQEILGLSDLRRTETIESLTGILERSRNM